MTWPPEGARFPTPEAETRMVIEQNGRVSAEKMDKTADLLQALVGRAEAAERREAKRERQDRIKFRVEIAGAAFGFIAAVTGIIALIVALGAS